ncbi:MAG TPA: pitrilysin family protein [Thermodesulfovibrionales bacterium]|nr:pitrilysin family protein [Thermodesulfovibrionales bacterium]
MERGRLRGGVRGLKGLLLLTPLALFFFAGNLDALDVKRTVLSSGLTTLQVERHNLPIVMVTLLVKASPLNESPEKAGLANITAELLTEGTKTRTSAVVSEETEFLGASLGASAGSDFTTVTLSVLKKDIERGFELFADIVLNPTFPDEEIRRQKELIKGGLRQSEEEPSFVADKAFKKGVFGDLPYGRLVTGSSGTIDAITREDIVRFHSEYYRPNNAILSVVGDLSASELTALIERFLPGWKAADVPRGPASLEPLGEKKTILIDRDLTQANIVLGHSGIRRGDPDYYAVSVMNYILGGGGFSSRLMQTVRDELGLAYDIHSFFDSEKEGGLFEVRVQTKNGSAKTVIDEIRKQIDKMRSVPVSEQEMDDAKSYLTGSFPRRLDTNRKIADFLTAVEFYGLGLDYVEKYPAYITAVTKEDVLRVARKYLYPERYVLVVVAKQSEAGIGQKEGK